MGAGASFTAAEIPDLSGKVVIVTGGTAGLGLATVVELARKRAHVIFTARNSGRGEEAMQAIKRELGERASEAKIEFGIAEQEDLGTVRAFASWFLAKSIPLNVLVLNAGVSCIPYKLIHGVESHLLINHVSHHLLTQLLLPKLKASAPSRVVVIASDAHQLLSVVRLEAPSANNYAPLTCYGNSKLANILFTVGLQKRVLDENIYVNAVHPGIVLTNLTYSADTIGFVKAFFDTIFYLFGQSPAKGALTQLYVAASPDIETRGLKGQYFYPTAQIREKLPRYAVDDKASERLWEWTENKIKEILDSANVPAA